MSAVPRILDEYRMVNIAENERILRDLNPVMFVGMLPRKRQWVNENRPSCCSFNIIIDGYGYLRTGDEVYELHAPCMFMPGSFPGCVYGPHDSWSELFIIYDANAFQHLKINGWIVENRVVYRGLRLGQLLPLLNELKELLDNVGGVGVADKIDYVCAGIIRESVMAGHMPDYDKVYRRMLAVRNQIKQKYNQDPNVDELAGRCAMSESTFRRNWKKYFGASPKQYALGIRMEQACALLISANDKIQDVARKTGFDDALYFSKAFRHRMGISPRKFREQYSVTNCTSC